MTTRNVQRLASFTALLFAAASATACENPVRPDEHTDVHGLAILQGDVEIARYFEGEVTGALPPVAAGGESALLTLVMLDHDGEPLHLSAEVGIWLRARPTNAAVAEFEVEGVVGEGFTGRVLGVAGGETTISFDLMHGEEPGGHAEFSTMGIPVVVSDL